MTAAEPKARTPRQLRVGVVVSDKGDKTIRVQYDHNVKHEKYGKYFRRSTKLAAHDEKNEAKVGDVVEIMACRPISKMKAWRLVRVLRPAGGM